MEQHAYLLAYIGPETILPLTSGLAAIMGVVLMFWGYLLRIIKISLRWIIGSKPAAQPASAPTGNEAMS